jgi:lipoate-protein ligase A
VGAVPGDSLLTSDPPTSDPLFWFDVERFRGSRRRLLSVRQVDRLAVVLGSTQPPQLVDAEAAAAAGVAILRRRSGGGAVHLQPGDPIWVDAWVPRGDPLWNDDVIEGATWAGRWWADALGSLGAGPLSVHQGPSVTSSGNEWSRMVCFAGMGPGEVAAGDRKVVGVAQWRCRTGVLVHTAAYLRWDPVPLQSVVVLPAEVRRRMAVALPEVAIGLGELLGRPADPTLRSAVVDRLLRHLPGDGWVSLADAG